MSQVDSIGSFIFTVTESGVNVTKNGYPQWVARLKATRKWVDDQVGMTHFGMAEPGWQDWSSFNEEITAFMVLFNNADVYNADTALLNYEQLQLATGWDGTSFDTLSDGSLLGKEILGRVEDNEWNGKISKRVNWIDSKDANPERQIKALDKEQVKALSSKLKITKTVKPAVATAAKATPAAKPAAKPGKPSPSTASPSSTSNASPAGNPAAPAAASPSSTNTAPPTAPKTTAAPSGPPAKGSKAPAPAQTDPDSLPASTTKEAAWDYLTTHKGKNADNDVADAWLSACSEVFGDRDEATATGEEWAKVRDVVIKDMAL